MTPGDIRPLRELVREAIIEALKASHGRTQIAAVRLGITQRHIYNKVREYKIDLADFRTQKHITFRKSL